MNKKNIWITVLALCLNIGIASVYERDDNEYQDREMTTIKQGPSCIQFGGDYTYVHFAPQGLPSFKGSLGGAQASYEYKPMNSFFGGLMSSWKQGNTHGTDGHRKLLYIDVQERFGYTVATCEEDFMFTFFTGLGYRHLGHKFTPTTGSVLYFRYNELYVPVGVLADYVATSWFTIGLEFTWMPQVFPTVSIIPLRGARWILSETLTNFYAALPLDFTLTKCKLFHLVLKPFYERWKDGHSTAKTVGLSKPIALGLPGNAYNFWGVDVNFAYHF